jgi:hypothetical protein
MVSMSRVILSVTLWMVFSLSGEVQPSNGFGVLEWSCAFVRPKRPTVTKYFGLAFRPAKELGHRAQKIQLGNQYIHCDRMWMEA